MTCTGCGAEVPAGAAFCNRCGAAVAGGAAGAGGTAVAAAPAPAAAPASGLSQNAAAAIAYLTVIPAIIFLLVEPYNKMRLVRFHAWQCIGLAVASVVLHLAAGFIPVVGWVAAPLISLAVLAVWVVCLIKASQGQYFKLPFIGDFAERQAGA